MKKYFIAKLKHIVKNDKGDVSYITEDYLVHAISYSDAEILVYNYAEQYWPGQFRIMSVTRQNCIDAFELNTDGHIYKLKFEFESEIDSKLNKIKKFTEYYYVCATSITKSIKLLEENLVLNSGSILGCEITESKKLKIVDFITEEFEVDEN